MSDDVKVKFGGDFSAISNGAEEAARIAGTSIQHSFTDAMKKGGTFLAGAFAVSSIATSIYSGLREAGEYFMELNKMIVRTGVDAKELQVLGKAGKESGVGIETIGLALNKTNKFLAEAGKGSQSQLSILQGLGFATDATSLKSLKAIDVIYKMSDEIKRTGDTAKYAAVMMEIFGRGGQELIPVLAQGSERFKEIAESTKLFTAEEIKAGAAAEKAARAAGHAWDEVMRRITSTIGEHEIKENISDAIWEAQHNVGANHGFRRATPEQQNAIIEEALRAGRKLGLTNEETMKYAMDAYNGTSAYSLLLAGTKPGFEQQEILKAIIEKVQEENENIDYSEDKEIADFSAGNKTSGAVVSSIQAIGGGDIQSIYSGSFQDSLLDNTSRTAQATEKIAATTPSNGQQPKEQPAVLGH